MGPSVRRKSDSSCATSVVKSSLDTSIAAVGHVTELREFLLDCGPIVLLTEQFPVVSVVQVYTGTFNTVNRSPEGNYVAVSSRGNLYLTWEPGQPYWQPHNRVVARSLLAERQA